MTREECIKKIEDTEISKDIKSIINDLSIKVVDVEFVYEDLEKANILFYPKEKEELYIPLIVEDEKIKIIQQKSNKISFFNNIGFSTIENRIINTYIGEDGIVVKEEI